MSPSELAFNKNEDTNKILLSDYAKLAKKIYQGGGEKSAAKQKDQGKLLARERITYLKDDVTLTF